MTCSLSEELLALHLSGDLEAQLSIAIALHVKGCEDCQQIIEDLQLSERMLASLFQEAVREDLQLIRIKVKERLTSNARRRKWFSIGALAAGLTVSLAPVVLHKHLQQVSIVISAQHSNKVSRSQTKQVVPISPPRQARNRLEGAFTQAGLREVILNSTRSGRPELTILTADPSVRILVQIDSDSYTHAN